LPNCIVRGLSRKTQQRRGSKKRKKGNPGRGPKANIKTVDPVKGNLLGVVEEGEGNISITEKGERRSQVGIGESSLGWGGGCRVGTHRRGLSRGGVLLTGVIGRGGSLFCQKNKLIRGGRAGGGLV